MTRKFVLEQPMKNIITYVKESGSMSFSESPFNQVDSLVFSYLVYYDLRKIVPPPKEKTCIPLEAAGRQYLRTFGNTQFNVN
ncbi:MAG: hypothetical protein IJG17_04115, partial [Eubacterium sp.]|nr:hypothetical protein [Eubacterium sp.]